MLPGRMMPYPLTLRHLLTRGAAYFSTQELLWRTPDREIHRTTYGELISRVARLARALQSLGVRPGDRVATLCWNHRAHFELYLAVPAMGAVVHPLNVRAPAEDLSFISRHAEDSILVVDRSLLDKAAPLRASATHLRHVIVIPDDGPVSPEDGLDYEALLARAPANFDFPDLDENAAAMLCYTSGTTGGPRGVLYSHRSTVLHALSVSTTCALGAGQADTLLPAVSMFHAAAWGLPYVALLTGAKLVLPGPRLDAASLLELLAAARVTITAGVPTIWLSVLAAMDQEPKRYDLSHLRLIFSGGAAAPPAMIDSFRERHGLRVIHSWGMTEMNPVGTFARVPRGQSSPMAEYAQGLPIPLVELRLRDEAARPVPHDGHTPGALEVRGPFVASGYYRSEPEGLISPDGWMRTGDVATIDLQGILRITDRTKDMIKSGGEWVSSVALENALMSHPAIQEAAVFAAADPKWGEVPVAAIVFRAGATAEPRELLAHLGDRFPRFWRPRRFIVLPHLPHGPTGKILKTELRSRYAESALKLGDP